MSSENILGDMFLSHDLSDVRVTVEDKMRKWHFPAHSLVLKRTSPVFRAMLESETIEGHTKTITITDFKAKHVKQFFQFLYTNTLPETCTGLCELLQLADKYLVQNLKERCEEALLEFVSLPNIYELANLSDLYSLAKLRGKCLSLFKRAAFKLLQCSELEYLSEELMKDICSANDLNVSSEIDVFWAIWKWGSWRVKYELETEISNESIGESIQDLLIHVRWSLMAEDDLVKVISVGITVDVKNLPDEVPRKPSMADSTWFVSQCDVLHLDDPIYCSSCTFIAGGVYDPKNCFVRFESLSEVRFESLSEAPFYLVGVLFACSNEPCGIVCRCGSAIAATERFYKYSMPVEIKSVDDIYQEVMCEFSKPVRVCKNQTVTLAVKDRHSFGSVKLEFHEKIIKGNNGRTIVIKSEAVYGIRQLFVL